VEGGTGGMYGRGGWRKGIMLTSPKTKSSFAKAIGREGMNSHTNRDAEN
jgi:hypothetical protein